MESNPVKEAMKEQGLTYEDAAKEIGITLQAVAQIVNGRTKGATARYALAKLLGRTVEQLWPDEPDTASAA